MYSYFVGRKSLKKSRNNPYEENNFNDGIHF